MLKETQKNKIVASYSKVLADIIHKQRKTPEEIIRDLENTVSFLGDIIKNEVSPLNYSAYKKAMSEVQKTLNSRADNDEIIKFLSFLLQRKYGFLLPNILEKITCQLQNKNGTTKIDVYSKVCLNDKIKDNVKKVINAQVENVEISFKISPHVAPNGIEFVSNGKLCVLNLQQITNRILNG